MVIILLFLMHQSSVYAQSRTSYNNPDSSYDKWKDFKKRQNLSEIKTYLNKLQFVSNSTYDEENLLKLNQTIYLAHNGSNLSISSVDHWIDMFFNYLIVNSSSQDTHPMSNNSTINKSVQQFQIQMSAEEAKKAKEVVKEMVGLGFVTWQGALERYSQHNKQLNYSTMNLPNDTNKQHKTMEIAQQNPHKWLAFLADLFYSLLDTLYKSPRTTRDLASLINSQKKNYLVEGDSTSLNNNETILSNQIYNDNKNPILDLFSKEGLALGPDNSFPPKNADKTSSISDHDKRPPPKLIWGYAFLFVTLICLCSMVGAIFISFMKKKYYKLMLQFMIGLAMGSLSGSAVFHLIPQTFDLVDSDTHHSYINKSATIIAGIYLFLITEWLIKITLEHRKKTKHAREAKRNAHNAKLLGEGPNNTTVETLLSTRPNSAHTINRSIHCPENGTRSINLKRKAAFKRTLNMLSCNRCYPDYANSPPSLNMAVQNSFVKLSSNGAPPSYLNGIAQQNHHEPSSHSSNPKILHVNLTESPPYKDPVVACNTNELAEARASLIEPTTTLIEPKKYASDSDILEKERGNKLLQQIMTTPTDKNLNNVSSPASRSMLTGKQDGQSLFTYDNPNSIDSSISVPRLRSQSYCHGIEGAQLGALSGTPVTLTTNLFTPTSAGTIMHNNEDPSNPRTSIYFNQYPGITPSPGFPNFEPFLDADEDTDPEQEATESLRQLNAISSYRQTKGPSCSPKKDSSLVRKDKKNGQDNEMIRTCSHEDIHVEGQSAIVTLAYMILLGDGLHNFIDGLSIGAAFSQNILTGVSISLAVLFEEFPHELGDFAILLNSGMPVRKAMICNFLSASTCYLGMFIGIFLGENKETSFYIFALAAGMFLYISLVDMMPELNKIIEKAHKSGNLPLTLVIQYSGIALGLISMSLLAKYGSSFTFS